MPARGGEPPALPSSQFFAPEKRLYIFEGTASDQHRQAFVFVARSCGHQRQTPWVFGEDGRDGGQIATALVTLIQKMKGVGQR